MLEQLVAEGKITCQRGPFLFTEPREEIAKTRHIVVRASSQGPLKGNVWRSVKQVLNAGGELCLLEMAQEKGRFIELGSFVIRALRNRATAKNDGSS